MKTPVLLLHGWGANRHIFKNFVQQLQHPQRVIQALDLPGHGSHDFDDVFNIQTIAQQIAMQMQSPQHLFAWSLGSLIALHIAAQYPEKVKSLTICAGFARLLAADDYPEGLKQVALSRMVPLFQQDYPRYMRQFLELQLMNTDNRQEIIHAVLPDVVQHGSPPALQAALNALEQADARSLLASIQAPTLLIYGGKDSITPARMGNFLQKNLPHAQMHIIERAAHAPFLSHCSQTATLFTEFIETHEQ